MKNLIAGTIGSGFLLLAMLTMTGCNDNDDSEFELVYATYWGGAPQANKGNAIAVDRDGYIYLAGETQSPSFVLKNPIVTINTSNMGFVSKFTPDGQGIVFSTYLGATDGSNMLYDMTVNDQGNAIAVGLAGGQAFPLKSPMYDTYYKELQNGFLTGIGPQGTDLAFSTFMPRGRITAVTLDNEQNIYLAGTDDYRSFLMKIFAAGIHFFYDYTVPSYEYSTCIEDIAVFNGAMIAAGWTNSPYYPKVNSAKPANYGQIDAFVIKLNLQGNDEEFALRFGGAGDDFARSVAVGKDGSIYICGSTTSADFPLKNAADTGYSGSEDCFAARIDPTNGTMLYSTFLGGSGEDKATSLALNAAGEAYLGGWTTSSDFPIRGAFQDHLGGVKDAFVAKLSADGDKILLSTYCGGSISDPYGSSETGADWGNDICLGPDGKVYITGETYASDFPLLNPLDNSNFLSKAFIAVLREKPL